MRVVAKPTALAVFLMVAGLAAVPRAQAQQSPVQGAIACAQQTNQAFNPNLPAFLNCTGGQVVLNQDSSAMVDCAQQGGGTDDFAQCAGRQIIGNRLSERQKHLVGCAAANSSDEDDFASCISSNLVADNLNRQQKALIGCAANNDVDSADFAGCAGTALLGDRLSPTAKVAIACAAQSQGDATGFAGCAANSFLNLNLNAEQQIAVQCVVTTGGQPYAAAGCAATRLMARELEKCSTGGFGGDDGCFGNNNELVGRNGFVVKNLVSIAGGPNSFVRDSGQVLGGPNSVLNNPRQVLGGPNSTPNQLLNRLPAGPPPLTLGTVGNHRVCIPWC